MLLSRKRKLRTRSKLGWSWRACDYAEVSGALSSVGYLSVGCIWQFWHTRLIRPEKLLFFFFPPVLKDDSLGFEGFLFSCRFPSAQTKLRILAESDAQEFAHLVSIFRYLCFHIPFSEMGSMVTLTRRGIAYWYLFLTQHLFCKYLLSFKHINVSHSVVSDSLWSHRL